MKAETIKILLVEDNPDHVILTKAALEENSVINEIYVVKDGQEALDFMYNRGKYSDAPKPREIRKMKKEPIGTGVGLAIVKTTGFISVNLSSTEPLNLSCVYDFLLPTRAKSGILRVKQEVCYNGQRS